LPVNPAGAPPSRPAPLSLADLWGAHGPSVYALACALLVDEEAAAEVVTLAMTDYARSSDGQASGDARRSLARRVYRLSQEIADRGPATQLPAVMVRLDQLAQLQRACLAVCVFGEHTYREAADLLGVPPTTVAELLTAGLREAAARTSGDKAVLSA